MQTVLTLMAVLAAAYVMAHWVVERLQARFLVTSGVEYILVGLLLGPQLEFSRVLGVDFLHKIAPVLSLAIGWVGLVYGMQADLRRLVVERDGAGQLSLVDTLLTMSVVGLLCHGVLLSGWVGDFTAIEAGTAAAVLGVSAVVGSTSVFGVLRRRFAAAGALTDLLDHASKLGELLAILAFGLVYCVFHLPVGDVELRWAEWFLICVALGFGLGVMFLMVIGDERDGDKQFLALLGIIVFAAGAAWYLKISPLFVNLVLGVTLANFARNAAEIRDTLHRYHRPMVVLLLVFAGALWNPVPAHAVILVVAYVLLRIVAKFLAGWVGAATSDKELRRDIGRGMLDHGEVAVAMAISFRLIYGGPSTDLVFTTVLASVVLSDLWSARALRGLLIDGGDIQADRRIADTAQGG